MPPKNYKLTDFRVEYDYTPYTFTEGIKTEITDYQLIIKQELVGARIEYVKIQDNYIMVDYIIPNGIDNRYPLENPIKRKKINFDKEKVIKDSVKVIYTLNELRVEFDLNSDYTAINLAIQNSSNIEEKVFMINRG